MNSLTPEQLNHEIARLEKHKQLLEDENGMLRMKLHRLGNPEGPTDAEILCKRLERELLDARCEIVRMKLAYGEASPSPRRPVRQPFVPLQLPNSR